MKWFEMCPVAATIVNECLRIAKAFFVGSGVGGGKKNGVLAQRISIWNLLAEEVGELLCTAMFLI